MKRLRASRRLRGLIVALSLCVLALRVAIPTGYMLDPGARGWPRLVACPAAQPMPAMHHVARHDHHHHHTGADHPCDFAAASAAVDRVALPQDAPPPHARADLAAASPRFFAQPGLGLAAPPPPKTGPPAFA